jgi:hypothetical protein
LRATPCNSHRPCVAGPVAADLVIATFDMELWTAEYAADLQAWPDNLVRPR